METALCHNDCVPQEKLKMSLWRHLGLKWQVVKSDCAGSLCHLGPSISNYLTINNVHPSQKKKSSKQSHLQTIEKYLGLNATKVKYFHTEKFKKKKIFWETLKTMNINGKILHIHELEELKTSLKCPTTQSGLQTQCSFYQSSKDIFHQKKEKQFWNWYGTTKELLYQKKSWMRRLKLAIVSHL